MQNIVPVVANPRIKTDVNSKSRYHDNPFSSLFVHCRTSIQPRDIIQYSKESD